MTREELRILQEFWKMCAIRLYGQHKIFIHLDDRGQKARVQCFQMSDKENGRLNSDNEINLLDIVPYLEPDEKAFLLWNLDVLA